MRTLDRSFAGGEVSPEMFGRIDLTAFQTGLATCRNFITLPHGPAANRPGTEYVNEVKTSAKRTRLIPFAYSTTQTMILEFGDGYLRFHTNGGTLVTGGGSPYEISTPYAEADLFDLHYVQSADVMTIVHPSYAPRELRRLAALNWTLTAISFSITQPSPGGLLNATPFAQNPPSILPPPESLTIAPTGGAGSDDLYYGVQGITDYDGFSGLKLASYLATDASVVVNLSWTAVGGAIGYRVYRSTALAGPYYLIAETSDLTLADNNIAPNSDITPNSIKPINQKEYTYVATFVGSSGEESVASLPVTAEQDLTYPGFSIILSISATVIPFVSFNIYKQDGSGGGAYGYIGSANIGQTVNDNNIEPDFTRQPPIVSNPFPSATNYPAAVSYFQQRRLFAGTINNPQNLWATRTGSESNFSVNAVVRDDDAISFRIAALKVSTIRHIIPLGEVLLLTNSDEWRLNSTDGGGLTPSTISVKPQSYIGASNVVPQVTDSSILYAQARGGHIREIVYTMADNGAVGYGNSDLSLLAPHLFNYKTIVDMAFAKAPYPILWAVSSDGQLLGMTYVPDQKVAGWHRHDTDGLFESCAVVSEGDEDFLYLVVRRTINGSSRRYIERMHSRLFAELKDAFFVDCGDTYSGAPTTTISGLSHLEGKQVEVLGDGATFPTKTVTGGTITLEKAVSLAHVGLPITADLGTLPMSTEQIEAFGQGRQKNISKVYLRVYRSSGVKAGPALDKLQEFKQRTNEPYDAPPRLMESAEIEIPVTPKWNTNGQIFVRQTKPLPVTVLSMALETSIGG